jgi:hypothetical protein
VCARPEPTIFAPLGEIIFLLQKTIALRTR